MSDEKSKCDQLTSQIKSSAEAKPGDFFKFMEAVKRLVEQSAKSQKEKEPTQKKEAPESVLKDKNAVIEKQKMTNEISQLARQETEKINPYDWVEQAFLNRKTRLENIGFKTPHDYFLFLTQMDDEMEKNPKGIIRELCEIYGVGMPYTPNFKYREKVAAYQAEKDDSGSYKHPYFDFVRPAMADLIRKGMADDIDDAYQKAIWLDNNVRKQLLAIYADNELNRKAAAAQKAKEASFSPHSKASAESKSKKTFRQELEELFNTMN